MHGLGFISINEWDWNMARPLAGLVLRDGTVNIIGLLSNCGVDSESSFRQCVASELGMKYEDVIIQEQRSDAGTYELYPPGGSWGTTSMVPQLITAARELKRKVLEYAVKPRPGSNFGLLATTRALPASFPGKRPEDLNIANSEIYESASPSNRKKVKEVADAFWGVDPAIVHPIIGAESFGLTSDGKPDATTYVMGRQAHFIEVAVDTETGQIDVLTIVCVNDVGHIFNRKGAEAQQYGGAVMGLGRSMTEEKFFCPRSGVALNNDLIGYHIGTMNDYPAVECILNESHLGYSAYGAYGIGENVGAALSGLSSAALYNALGKWILDYPTTPDRVLRALGKI
jgi:CO/xanthine dehydrogenase Mo-binding subunit